MIDTNKIRRDFPILNRKINGHNLVYFDSAATSQKPKQVLEAVKNYYENHNANVHRGVHTLSVEATEMMDKARVKIADFVGGRREEIIFVRNATEAINLVAFTYGETNVQAGDEIVVSMMEHHSNIVPWQRLCEGKKAKLNFVEVDSEGKLVLDDLKNKLNDKTKIVALTWVSNVLGTINPIEMIATIIKQKAPNAVFLIDACQAVPHMEVNVLKTKADFISFSGHKMLGLTSTGVLWGKKEILEKMEPFLTGGDMINEVTKEKTTWNELPYKFEAGTPDIAGAIALAAAVDYLSGLGMKNVREHEKDLISYALEKMMKLETEGWVEIYGPRESEIRGGVLTFNVKGVHAHDSATVLDNAGIEVRSGQHCGALIVKQFGVNAMVRASFYFYNTKAEIDYMIEKLSEIRKIFNV